MLPLYVAGNLHCIGMCGPLVFLLGKHPYRYLYFAGRSLSFAMMAGLWAASGGVVMTGVYRAYFTLGLGVVFFLASFILLFSWGKYLAKPFAVFGNEWNKRLSLLLLQNSPSATFFFGFFTVFLPCGQSLIVFSACALAGSFWTGALNGLAFAVLTSPSLVIAMHAHGFLSRKAKYYQTFIGLSTLFLAILTIARGLADLGVISHLALYSHGDWHLVLY